MTTRRLLAVADTDSYLKWSVATLAALPPGWSARQVVVRNPVAPSLAQIAAAGAGEVAVVGRAELRRLLAQDEPDAVLLACTGPVVAALTDDRALQVKRRPVLLTGLPGISVPATRRAVQLRAGCDLFLLHSRREVAEFTALGEALAPGLRFGLARLPFLAAPAEPTVATEPAVLTAPVEAEPAVQAEPAIGLEQVAQAEPALAVPTIPTTPASGKVVFAAQAKVPAARADRERILTALAGTGSAVVKLRAAAGEQQTHQEAWSYPDLLARMLADGRVEPGAVGFVNGSMSAALSGARGLVTVSSTAALEAIAAGVPVLVLDDFGVSAELLNLVFADSGCLGSLADLAAGVFRRPDRAWLDANYFHPAAADDWPEILSDLLRLRDAGGLAARPRVSAGPAQRLRRRLRLAVPARSLPWLRALRHPVRAARRAPGRRAPARLPARQAG